MNDRNAAVSRRIVLASLAWALPGAVVLGGTIAPTQDVFGQTPETDLNGTRAAPNCVLKLAPSGQSISIDKFRGKVVYVDFWASWCAPCLLSFPFMNQLQRSYAGQGLQVMAINMDEKPDNAQQFLAEHPASFSVAMGPNPQCAKDFGVADMPSSFLVDRKGIIRGEHAGFRPGDVNQLRGLVERLLAEK
jgi:thiol-disulfide isomerase/thioredoxin